MLKAVKFRLYPNTEQRTHLAQSFGCARWYWNYSLALTQKTYQETGKGLSRGAIQGLLPQLKKEYEWLKEPYSQCLQVVALNLSNAFINFFEGRGRFPRFKAKGNKQSISYPQNVKVLDGYIKFPKLKLVEAKISKPIEGTVKTVTISQVPSGKYYASILVDDGIDNPESSSDGKCIGLDVGISHICVTSEGSKYNNPSWFKKHQKNLKRKQQKLARKQKGSNNRYKARKLAARVYEKVSNCRLDFLHKLSRRIVDENQVIAVENLAVKNMVKNPKLALAISNVGWGMLNTMLKYKAEWTGKVYMQVDRFFPSSKLHNKCLYRIDKLPLDVRFWDCPNCGEKHIDRDINAAKNIRDEALRLLALGRKATAHGGTVSLGSGREKSTTEQVPAK
ncbi:MAG: RNA-guided endonuclease TnpB family protein [Cyanobacteria bacterium P01_A01_bin.83]